MARVFIIVEGETEETFINEVIAPHLRTFGHQTTARLMGNARLRSRRGGIQGWPAVANDIVRRLTDDPTCYLTTMVDYYALPSTGHHAWPGRTVASTLAFPDMAFYMQQELANDIAVRMNASYNPQHFIPFVMMHEFEGLLFSDCPAFATGIGHPNLGPHFQNIRNQFITPEAINDSPLTAPSKRVELLVPGYEKPFMGTIAALEIGLHAIRTECPLFSSWIDDLEALQ